MYNDVNTFCEYTLKNNNEINSYVEYEMIDKLVDEKLIQYIMEKFFIEKVEDIPMYFKDKTKEELDAILKEITNIKGTNVTQIARITRLGRRCIEKTVKK